MNTPLKWIIICLTSTLMKCKKWVNPIPLFWCLPSSMLLITNILNSKLPPIWSTLWSTLMSTIDYWSILPSVWKEPRLLKKSIKFMLAVYVKLKSNSKKDTDVLVKSPCLRLLIPLLLMLKRLFLRWTDYSVRLLNSKTELSLIVLTTKEEKRECSIRLLKDGILTTLSTLVL